MYDLSLISKIWFSNFLVRLISAWYVQAETSLLASLINLKFFKSLHFKSSFPYLYVWIYFNEFIIWEKKFKNGSSKFCGRYPFKDLKEYCLLKQTILLQISQRLSSTNVTWSILEYFVIYASSNAISITRIGTHCDATLY